MSNPTQTQSWQKLSQMTSDASAPKSVSCDGVSIDFSKSMISNDIWDGLLNLAADQNVERARADMFSGEPINVTEKRAVLHTALRSGTNSEVLNVLNQMRAFVEKTHENNKFTDVVHIGIGGSDLGPRLVCDALKHLPKAMSVHFVSNVDGAHIAEILKPLSPETTLFVIASKTFTTQETMMNAKAAKSWLGALPVADHMIALSTNESAVTEFGIDAGNMFPFWNWVGGRFSVWSAIGMPIALTYGFDVFQEFLNGAKAMDDHFVTAPLSENIPVCLALYGVWNRNFMKRPALAVLPYAQNLDHFAAYLQQTDMESNGKSVDRNGDFISDYETGPIVFGQVGTNGQHAFHQWLHQGTDIVPCEIICIKHTHYDADHHRVLNAHAAAQAQAFFEGRSNADNSHRHYVGARPSVMIKLNDLTPFTMGQLLAMYEHKIFVQGVIWNINSFDQWGVELGKDLAQSLLA